MGIPSYFKYIISNYEIIFKKLNSIERIDNLYIDSNSIIYDCLRNIDMTTYDTLLNNGKQNKDVIIQFEEELQNKVLNKIINYIEETKPKKRVYVALDGVVPYAKMEQQRQRRYKSAFTKKIENELIQNFNKSVITNINEIQNTKMKNELKSDMKTEMKNEINEIIMNKNKFTWDQTAITPGTNFMKKLDAFLEDKLGTNPVDEIKTQQCSVMFSGSNIAGEGEHKIFEYLRDKNNNHNNDNTCIYGLDADLIMLSLNHIQYSRRIYLMREKPDFNDELDNIYNPNELMFMSINYLASNIVSRMINKKDVNKDIQLNKIQDYIFISFLLGNDFMPHFPGLNIRIDGIETLFNYYSDTFGASQTIIKDKKIVWKNLRKFLEKLAKHERDMIIKNTHKHLKDEKYKNNKIHNDAPDIIVKNMINKIQDAYENENQNINQNENNKSIPKTKISDISDIIDNYRKEYVNNQLYNFNILPCKNRVKEEFINPQKNGWEQRYYYSLFNIDKKYLKCNDDDTKVSYNNIIKEVCINYLEGLEWCFHYYNFGCKDTKWKYSFSYPPLMNDLYKYTPLFDTEFLNTRSGVIDTMSLLCYVIPKEAFHLVPKHIIDGLNRKYNYNYDEKHKFIWAYSKYFWESHVEFPYVNFDDFAEYVQKLYY